jgi:hypothetical protein
MRSLLAALLSLLLIAGLVGRTPLHAESAIAPQPSPDNAVAAKAAAPSEVPQRLTLAVVGDSLGDGLWEALYRQLRDNKRIVVHRGCKRSVGFTTSEMTEQIDAAFAAGPVHAVVVMIGANDDRRSFFSGGRSQALFATDKWVELYRARIDRYMDHAAAEKVPFVWVLLPIMRTAEATAAAHLVNGIITEAAHGRPYITLIPTWRLTSDDKGAYMPYFDDLSGRKRLMRHSDGLHFSEPGYELLAHMTFEKVMEVSPLFATVGRSPSGPPSETPMR